MKRATEKLLVNLSELLKVKTIITLVVIFTISILTMKEKTIDPMYYGIASGIIAYFFTKKESGKGE